MASPGKKVLFISHDSGRTGAPIGLLAFMRWLRANTNLEIGTILRGPGPLAPSFRELGPILILGSSQLLRSRLGRRLHRLLPSSVKNETRAIRNFFAAGAYDLIYSNTMTNGSALETLADFNVPVITHVHELEYWILRSGVENLQRVLSRTRTYIAASQAVKHNLVRNHQVPDERITTIYEHIREVPPLATAAERQAARAALGIPAGATVVGGCGAEHWRKGRDLIPQLLVALQSRELRESFHFVWIGRPGSSDDEYTLQHDLRSAGIAGRFHTSGEVENPFALFPAIDVFALLSRDDPFPLACLEVAANETPVVCFAQAGGMPEFVRDDCGSVVPYLDIGAMADCIVYLAREPELRRAQGRLARSRVTENHTLAATGPQLLNVINGMLRSSV